VTLAAWSLGLVSWFVKAWGFQLGAIDQDPRAMLSPSIAHDLELQGHGLQLLGRRVTYFYCEFFHIFILLFNCVCFRALEAWSLKSVLACGFVTSPAFLRLQINFLHLRT